MSRFKIKKTTRGGGHLPEWKVCNPNQVIAEKRLVRGEGEGGKLRTTRRRGAKLKSRETQKETDNISNGPQSATVRAKATVNQVKTLGRGRYSRLFEKGKKTSAGDVFQTSLKRGKRES